MLRPHAEQKNLTLNLEVDPDIPFSLIGDNNLTKQVLVNLIGNAIKYTHDGNVIVRVSLNDKNDEHCNLCFEIVDTGIGIKKDNLGAIFDRFSQADDSDTRMFEGAGLGTAIAKEIVECLNGEIGVESDYGKGSTFWFKLPYEIEKMSYEHDNSLNGMRVIFVNEEKQNYLYEILTGWGITLFSLTHEADIIKAINDYAVENKSIHAIIYCDSNDGNIASFIQKLKNNEHLKTMPLITINQDVNAPISKKRISAIYGFTFPADLKASQLFNALHSFSLELEDNESTEESLVTVVILQEKIILIFY